jgi:flagellar L-ring protein precursor FlgH
MKRVLLLLLVGACAWGSAKKKAPPKPTPMDTFVRDATTRPADAAGATPGSVWTSGSRLADAARDVRASQVDDLVTILVSESTSAVSTGATKTQRQSSTQNAITGLVGIPKATSALANLANTSGNTQLNGQGTTSRSTTLTATLTARVTKVLPNGALVVESTHQLQVNSEHQTLTITGVIRPEDIDTTNSVSSNRVGELTVYVDGKGVVNDAIKRPFILYRLLLGLLPF